MKTKKHFLPYQIYLYVVFSLFLLFNTLHIGWCFWGTAKMVLPAVTISNYRWEHAQDLHFYKEHLAKIEERKLEEPKDRLKKEKEVEIKVKKIWADENKEIEEKWKKERALLLKREQLDGKQMLLKSLLWLLVLLPLLLIHLKLIVRLYRKK